MQFSLDSQRPYRKLNDKAGQRPATEPPGHCYHGPLCAENAGGAMFPERCRERGQQFLPPVTSQHNMLWRGPFRACRLLPWEKQTHHLSCLSLDKDKDKRCPNVPVIKTRATCKDLLRFLSYILCFERCQKLLRSKQGLAPCRVTKQTRPWVTCIFRKCSLSQWVPRPFWNKAAQHLALSSSRL